MANRYGTSYQFDQRYNQQYEDSNTTTPRLLGTSRIHQEVYQLAKDKKQQKEDKERAELEKQRKKEYILSGSGHKCISRYLTPRAKRPSSNPVSDEQDQKKGRITEEPNTDIDNNSPGEYDPDEMNLNEQLRVNEEELERQLMQREEEEETANRLEKLQKASERKASIQKESVGSKETEDGTGEGSQDEDATVATSNTKGHTKHVCKGCGNEQKDCHNIVFGDILMHEIFTQLCDMEPAESTDSWIGIKFFDKYNIFLRFHCFQLYGRYEEKQNYALPDCIISGSLKRTKLMVKHQVVISELNKKRGYGVAERFFYKGEPEVEYKF